jgi:hypothetical protein
MRIAVPITVLVTALACSLGTAPANARARVFVASYGNDSNPCTFGSPCKTFQQAVNVVDAGGEVTAIDSAGFGPINITKAVTITSPDGVEAGIVPTAGGNAITIDAGSTDAIVLRGLTLNGSGVGANGIVFNSGGSLTVNNCAMQNFVSNGGNNGNGILIQPTTGSVNFVITNTTASNNTTGIVYGPPGGSPNANGVIDHVVATANVVGIVVNNSAASGGATDVAISNTVASDNSANGFFFSNVFPLLVSIDNASATGNGAGITADGSLKVLLGRSVVTLNGTGVQNNITSSTFFSFDNNQIAGNNVDISSPLTPIASH